MAKKSSKVRLIPQYGGGYKDRAGRKYTQAEGSALLNSGKATRTAWKSKQGNTVSYEGDTYRGGRKKGSGNLTKTAGGYVNQHGVSFTAEQKKALEKAVDKSNYRRKKMLEAEGQLDRLSGGQPTGQKVAQLQLMGKESDFIITRQSKSLQQFKSMEDFEKFMGKQERIASGEYLEEKTRAYKRNHMAALKNVFGDSAKDVIMKIRMMKPEDYRRLIQSEENLEVSYIYDPSTMGAKLNQIRTSLGMAEKYEDEYEDEEGEW